MWFQLLSWGNRVRRFIISYCQQHMNNFCWFFMTKKKNHNIFVEKKVLWLLIGTLSLCEKKQIAKFVKS